MILLSCYGLCGSSSSPWNVPSRCENERVLLSSSARYENATFATVPVNLMDPTSVPSRPPLPQPTGRDQTDPVPIPPAPPLRVLWTRGDQCRTLAHVLGRDTASRADTDVATACIRTRATLLVARHLTSFELCSVAVPHGFSPETTLSVVAAVGGGPHSRYAATLAERLARQLGVPARAVFGYRHDGEDSQARDVLADIAAAVPDLRIDTLQAPNPAALVSTLPTGTLLVVGAPGGSWFQRQFFGPGARIQSKAPNGTIVVRSAPPRVYQIMQPPTAFGPHMRIADAARIAGDRHAIVAQDGELLGIVPRSALTGTRPDVELVDVMESAVFLSADEAIDDAAPLLAHYRGNPVPVLDNRARLVGVACETDLADRPLL